MKKVVGKNLYIKEICLQELTDDVMNWFQDGNLMKFYTNSGRAITKSELIDSIQEGKKNRNLFTFGIYTLADNHIIGTLKLGPINNVHKTSDLAALIGDRNYLGKGLSSEAISLGNDLAFNEFGIRKLYGYMYQSNIASIKAYLRAGWLIEGRLKGQYIVNGKCEDRILVACFNPDYFTIEEISKLKDKQKEYYE